MASRYASNTQVPTHRSRAELEVLLSRYGADAFAYAAEGSRAAIMFRVAGRAIRFTLPLPDRLDPDIALTETGRERSPSAHEKAYEQACRSRWRALLLVVKAKLEAIEAGISTVEHEFLAWMVTASGATVGEQLVPQIESVVAQSSPMKLLGLEGGDHA